MKRIKITETNNSPNFLIAGSWATNNTDFGYLKKLKKFVEKKGFAPPGGSPELKFVKYALNWVTVQWKHDGMTSPPESYRALDILSSVYKNGTQYRCVEFGIVLSEILQSYGFVTRTIALRTPHSAYGGFGQGHVAMEVWLNDFGKWIFLDPQFGAYLTSAKSKTPLNYYEIFQKKQSGSWGSLNINFSPNSNLSAFHSEEDPNAPQSKKHMWLAYKDFLKNYFGMMVVAASKKSKRISLLLESQNHALTFQGAATGNILFTTQPELIYPEVNRVALLLNFRDKKPDISKVVQDLKIKSNDDYLKNMSAFAAKPRFLVKIVSSPNSKNNGYEYRTSRGGEWVFTEKSKLKWDAMNEDNYLEVRAINNFERKGPITFVNLEYK